jgi:hypothetical protein
MPLTTVGAQCAASLIAGDGGVSLFGNTAFIGVGTSATAFSVGQTDLIGTSERKQVSGVSGTFPSPTRTYTATFTTSDGNYAWLEIGLFNEFSGGQMLARRTVNLGTKPDTESWTVNLEVTYAAG